MSGWVVNESQRPVNPLCFPVCHELPKLPGHKFSGMVCPVGDRPESKKDSGRDRGETGQKGNN